MESLILLYLTKSKNKMSKENYIFEFEGIKFPKKVKSSSGRYISFENYILPSSNYNKCSRNSHLDNKHRSSQEKVLDYLISINHFNVKVIREFPVIRRDGDGLFYLIDYYIPTKGIAIELDSGFHNKNEDNIRDSYLRSLGLKIFRIYNLFNEFESNIKYIKDIIESEPDNFILFDYSDIIKDYIEYLHKGNNLSSTEENKLKMSDDELLKKLIRPKWREAVLKLNSYDNKIIESLRVDDMYSFIIPLDEIYKLIPLKEKQVRAYNSLTRYLSEFNIILKVKSPKNK